MSSANFSQESMDGLSQGDIERAAIEFNDERNEHAWNALQQWLEKYPPEVALRLLYRQQLDAGFIRDDLSEVRRYKLEEGQGGAVDRGTGRHLRLQFNARRADRHRGAGRRTPPRGRSAKDNGCFLCRHNVAWAQSGVELGYAMLINGTNYIAWPNPYPIMPTHFTVAAEGHTDQPSEDVGRTVPALLELARKLPHCIAFVNGKNAGASIPSHEHFQVFERMPHDVFPLELEAGAGDGRNVRPMQMLLDYPLAAIRYSGTDAEEIARETRSWMMDWSKECGAENVSANIIATMDSVRPDLLHLYFVPRHAHYSHGPGMHGTVGALEVLGEMIFCLEDEKRRIDANLVDYAYARSVLRAVEPPRVRDFLKGRGASLTRSGGSA